VAVDTPHGELKAGLRRARDRLLRLELGSITLDLGLQNLNVVLRLIHFLRIIQTS
jgi:hypothetical protein